jgi:four helix bundle protein
MTVGREEKEVKEVKEVEGSAERGSPIRNYTDLLIYKQAYRLALEVSKLTRSFPRHEQYELGRQLRNASRSVAANIVEGWAKRNSAAEFKRHLLIANGEGAETKFWLDLAGDEGCARKERCEALKAEYGKLSMMIHNLWKEWRKLS